MTKELKKLRKFILNDLTEKYEEVLDHIPKTTLFKTENIILFINDYQKTVWIWIGVHVTQKQRFLASYKAPDIRNYHAYSYTIKVAEQNDEPLSFRMMKIGRAHV